MWWEILVPKGVASLGKICWKLMNENKVKTNILAITRFFSESLENFNCSDEEIRQPERA